MRPSAPSQASGSDDQRYTGAKLQEAQRFLLISILLGMSAGLLVVCFHMAIDVLSWVAQDAATSLPRRVLVTGLGAGLATALVHYVFRASAGSGIVQTKSALYASDGFIPPSAMPGKFITSAISLGAGTPLGPEDPALLMGAGAASILGRVFRLTRPMMRLVAPVGAAAGIAAAFNTPITGVLFVIEEVVSSWNAAVLGSIVLAAVSAVVTARWFLGDFPLFQVPAFTLADPRELVIYATVGLVGGVLGVLYVRGMLALRHRCAGFTTWSRTGQACLVGFVVGAAGWFAPEVLGPGYDTVDSALHNQYDWSTLVVLALLKLLLTTLAFGSGTPGGLFAPTLFIGAMLGGGIGTLARDVVPFPVSPASAYVLAGMGTFFAAAFRAPMTSIFMVFELSASYIIIVPVMVANTVAYLLARQLQPRPLFDQLASQEGMVLPSTHEMREVERLSVEAAMRPPGHIVDATGLPAIVAAGDPSDRVAVRLDGRWCIVRRDRIGEVRLRPAPIVYPDEWLETALGRLSTHDALPVVSRANPTRLLGVLTLADIHAAYGIAPEPGDVSRDTPESRLVLADDPVTPRQP